MYQVRLEKFEGPLDLLLQLIEAADLDITEFSIADVAEQFMKYLEQVEEKNPDELADFLVVAAKLLLIKSRVLLPSLDWGAEEEEGNLEQQLRIYKEYYEASKKIEEIIAKKNVLFLRDKIPLDLEAIFNPPKNLSDEKLKNIFLEILKEIEPIIKLPQRQVARVISIREKIEQIRNKFLSAARMNFKELLAGSKNKTEVIITFLGVLELVKQRVVAVKQDRMFDEIIIEANKSE